MIPWKEIEQTADTLNEGVETVTLELTTLQFVVVSEILLDAQKQKRVHMDQPAKVQEVLKSIPFTFKKRES